MGRPFVQIFALLFCASLLLVSTAHAEPGDPGDATEGGASTGTGATPQSSVSHIDVFFIKEYGKTSIVQRVCGNGPHFQLRSESVGNWFTEVFYRTQAANGCSPSTTSWWRMVYNAVPGSQQFRIYATNNETRLSDNDFMERAVRHLCTVTAYGAGTCTRETVTVPRNDVNEPGDGQTMQGTINVRGWATDLASLDGPGVNEIHVYAGDTFLGVAGYGEARGDVASAFGDSRFTNSGYNYSLDTTRIPNGATTIRVAAKSTLTGQWSWFERRVVVDNQGSTPQPDPKLTRSRLFLDSRQVLVLEFCGTNIHQDVFVGAKRAGKDFGTRSQRVDFGEGEQCATNDRILDGSPRPGLTYQTGVALSPSEVYNVCSPDRGLCTSFTMPAPQSTGFKLPFPGGATKWLTQGNNGSVSHYGYSAYAFDWGLRTGEPVVASRAGRVIKVRQDSGRYGCSRAYINDANSIVIRHDDGTDSLYAHLRQNSARVNVGDFVQSGQVIAEVGRSGYICGVIDGGAHLHYSVGRSSSSSQSIPTSFVDVPINGGVPTAGRAYTSGNYLAQITSQLTSSLATTEGMFPPEGNVLIRLTGGTTYTLQVNAYDYESDDLQMRVADTQTGIDTAPWQTYAPEIPWTSSQAWVQYQDADGLTSEVYSDTISPIAYQPIQADFIAPATSCTNQVIEIQNTTATFCPQCVWKWLHGDGTSSTTEIPSTGAIGYEDIAYSDPGEYTISLTATNAVTESTVTKQITVLPSPSADFTMTRKGATIRVEATDTTATAWEWSFGDGTTATGQVVTHTYSDEAIAELPPVQLEVSAANSCRSDSLSYVPAVVESKVFLPVITR